MRNYARRITFALRETNNHFRNTRDEFNRTRAPPGGLNGNFSLVAHEDGIVAIVGDPCLSLSFSYKAKLDDLMVSQKSFSRAIVCRKLAEFLIFFTRETKYAVRR